MYEIPLKAKVIVKCPDCGARVCDVIKGTKGCIEIKCPECKKVSRIKLSFRLSNPINKEISVGKDYKIEVLMDNSYQQFIA